MSKKDNASNTASRQTKKAKQPSWEMSATEALKVNYLTQITSAA